MSKHVLYPYATTDRQKEILAAIMQHKGMRKAATALNLSTGTVGNVLTTLKRRAALKGVAPENDLNYPLAEGEILIGRSVHTKTPSGDRVWVKTKMEDQHRLMVMREVVESLKEDLPKYSPMPYGGRGTPELLNLYVVTDYHLGMKAWHEEAGEDWDMQIAEQLLLDWLATAVGHAPEADVAILANLGDLMHWDGYEAVTPAHKHLLDADTRFQKLVRVAIRTIRQMIDMLLHKHKQVHVLMADANHDPASGAWLRELLASVYENEPRITVDTSADTYYCYEHGSTSLFFHHGHKRGLADVDRVFAGKYRQVFGRTKHAYAHLGHLHSNELKESQLMIVERHRTLAAADAYAAKGGWISGREAKVITYSRTDGEVFRISINPEMAKRGGLS